MFVSIPSMILNVLPPPKKEKKNTTKKQTNPNLWFLWENYEKETPDSRLVKWSVNDERYTFSSINPAHESFIPM